MGLMAFVGFALLLAAVCGAARDASAGTGRQLGASGSRQHLEGVVAGQGDYRFRLRTDLLKLPEGVKMRNGHGLVKDPDGRIYFTFEPMQVDDETRALVRFNPDGSGGELLGRDNTLAWGVPHGLRISFEEGQAFLYHANNGHTVHKTDLEGNIVWSNNVTDAWSGTSFWPCLPTDAVVPLGSSTVYVADGYGSSFVHLLDASSGEYLGTSFGGKGSSTSPQQFDCPHGINFDQDSGLLVVSDRSNARLQYVELNGSHRSTVDMSVGSRAGVGGHQPDNVDLRGSPSTSGKRDLLIPSLDGTVSVLAGDLMDVLSVMDVGKLLGPACPHPHDAIFLDNGDMVLCCWNPGHLSYWEKLPAEDVATA